jgi:hypothetical protein
MLTLRSIAIPHLGAMRFRATALDRSPLDRIIPQDGPEWQIHEPLGASVPSKTENALVEYNQWRPEMLTSATSRRVGPKDFPSCLIWLQIWQ